MIKYTLREILFWSESLLNLPTSNMTTKTLRSARRKLLTSVRFPDDAVDSVESAEEYEPGRGGPTVPFRGSSAIRRGDQSRKPATTTSTNWKIWCRILNGWRGNGCWTRRRRPGSGTNWRRWLLRAVLAVGSNMETVPGDVADSVVADEKYEFAMERTRWSKASSRRAQSDGVAKPEGFGFPSKKKVFV